MTVDETKSGISRRDLIKKGAVAGAIVWTIPMIETVPAYAAGGSTISTACSYFVLVYTYQGNTYADRIGSSGNCAGNTTSSDVAWCYTCGGHTYDNLGGLNAQGHGTNSVRQDGIPLLSSGCTANSLFSVSGNTVTPNTGVTILFAVAHAGSLNSGTGQDPGTPPTVPVSYPYTCAQGPSSLQDKVNVACAPISSATFSCLPAG